MQVPEQLCRGQKLLAVFEDFTRADGVFLEPYRAGNMGLRGNLQKLRTAKLHDFAMARSGSHDRHYFDFARSGKFTDLSLLPDSGEEDDNARVHF